MSIVFRCSSCGRRLRGPDQAAGRRARCQCGKEVTVPLASGPHESTGGVKRDDMVWRPKNSSSNDFASAEPVPAHGRMTACADCGVQMSRRAVACPSCGCPAKPTPDSRTCIDCGREVSRYESACWNCGCPVEQAQPVAPNVRIARASVRSADCAALEPHRGGVILTFGILSLLCFGIILGPIAWVMASNDLRAMATGRMDRSGERLTRIARICAIIGTITAACLIVLALASAH
jgi:hypothetical protein